MTHSSRPPPPPPIALTPERIADLVQVCTMDATLDTLPDAVRERARVVLALVREWERRGALLERIVRSREAWTAGETLASGREHIRAIDDARKEVSL